MGKKLLILMLLILTVLVGCTGNKSSGENNTSKKQEELTAPNVDLPRDIVKFDEDSIQIHYKRNDFNYAPWSLWLWGSGDGKQYEFNYLDDFGVVASYKLSDINIDINDTQLGFIVAKLPSWSAKDVGEDRFIDFQTLEKDENGVYHVYLFSGDSNIYSNADKVMTDKILSASFIDEGNYILKTNNVISKVEVYKNDNKILEKELENGAKEYSGKIDDFALNNIYTIKVTFKESGNVIENGISLMKLYSLPFFDSKYSYDGELGAIYSKDSTTFKVWSPVSNKIVLRIYDNGTPLSVDSVKGSDSYQEYEMTLGEKGVYSYTLSGDLEGKYYTYVAFNSSYPKGKETIDPYAKSAGVNGIRGMIVDFSKTNPEGWDDVHYLNYDRKELTVWETHVADPTSSTTWTGTEENRKKFLGLIEEGTTYTNGGVTVKTGFDHIIELGVNAVQIMPLYDQANDEVNVEFNWGYNPLNYNVVEGAYSSNPYDGYARIREFKQVVQAFNNAGITVIMDVVYNHTSGVKGQCFDTLVPGYYYRYQENGSLYNGSGCGNETASERVMFRKYMIDSIAFWTEEYKLGGYRFDLMGLHDVTTMNKVVEKAKEVNPNIVIYGEPWTGGTSGLADSQQAKQSNLSKYVGYGAFNDQLRDELIKGGMNSVSTKSWISDVTGKTYVDKEAFYQGIKGITISSTFSGNYPKDPDKTVNYATCHDNYTLFDRFKAAKITDEVMIKKMAMLANSIVFTSQGTTFMLAGEEMLRTKDGNGNSYNASYEVNELNYQWKIDNMDMFENYQLLIKFKKEVDGMHLDANGINTITITPYNDGNMISYEIQDKTNSKTYIVIHSNGVDEFNRDSFDLTGYTLYLDTLNRLEGTLGIVKPLGFETIIAYK